MLIFMFTSAVTVLFFFSSLVFFPSFCNDSFTLKKWKKNYCPSKPKDSEEERREGIYIVYYHGPLTNCCCGISDPIPFHHIICVWLVCVITSVILQSVCAYIEHKTIQTIVAYNSVSYIKERHSSIDLSIKAVNTDSFCVIKIISTQST